MFLFSTFTSIIVFHQENLEDLTAKKWWLHYYCDQLWGVGSRTLAQARRTQTLLDFFLYSADFNFLVLCKTTNQNCTSFARVNNKIVDVQRLLKIIKQRTVLVVQTKATRQTQTGTPLVKPKQEPVVPVIPCKYTQYF